MIRYPTGRRELANAVDKKQPSTARRKSWRQRAAETTAAMKTQREFLPGPDWSDIKEVYVQLQHSKCAYCEKKLEAGDFGLIEHDVEHYRPKNPVRSWPPSGDFSFPVRNGAPDGYYLLAYDLMNYCTSCKVCNTILKSNCFPIAGEPGSSLETDVRPLNRIERPFIPYPLGALDEDPQRIIAFEGIAPVPVARRGRRRQRALVTIRFFRLDVRERLLEQRCLLLKDLYRALRDLAEDDPALQEEAVADIERMTSKEGAHSNFASAFLELFESDPAQAAFYFRKAGEYLRTGEWGPL